MTELKFEILKLLYNDEYRKVSEIEILNSRLDKLDNIYYALKELDHCGYIETEYGTDAYILSSSGACAFEMAQQERDKASKKEKQQRFDNKMSVASVLVPFITFVFGIFAEHYMGIFRFIALLFH